MKRCLLVSPLTFYSWHTTISAELEERGYKVDLANDEYPTGTLGLIVGTFLNRLCRKLTLINAKKIFEELDFTYDLVLIFKGRGVSPELIELYKSKANRVVAYNFDSFSYFGGASDWFHLVDKFCTFDYLDSEKLGIQQIDLFTDQCIKAPEKKSTDISCVLKNHSDRLKYLDCVHAALGDAFTFNIYIYEKNLFTLLKGAIRTPKLMKKWWRFIHLSSLNNEQYIKFISDSKYTLDYAHPSQTGLTMRCFQAASCGTGLITNNPRINQSANFEEINKVVFGIDSNPDLIRRYLATNLNDKSNPMVRTAKDFLDDLIDE